jgi:type IV fimbrial biogenesis protein FimT
MVASPKGFTLWELMMALVVAGIVLGIGVPSFMSLQRSNAMTAAANDLVGGVLMAKTEAVKRQAPVTLCSSPNPTASSSTCGPGTGGFIVFVDENGNGVTTDPTDGNAEVDAGETVLLQRSSPGGVINVFSDSGYIAYGPNGVPRHPAAQARPPATAFLYCDDRGNSTAAGGLSAARVVRIEPTGRPQVRQAIADVAAATAAIEGASCPQP